MPELKFAENLKVIMKDRNLTIGKLSVKAGVPKTTLAHLLAGQTATIEQVKKISDALGVSIHHLCYGGEDMNSEIYKILREEVFSGTFEISVKRVRFNEK